MEASDSNSDGYAIEDNTYPISHLSTYYMTGATGGSGPAGAALIQFIPRKGEV